MEEIHYFNSDCEYLQIEFKKGLEAGCVGGIEGKNNKIRIRT